MGKRLHVGDLIGPAWMQTESEFLGIVGNKAACAMFDSVFREELACAGAINGNAMKVVVGTVGYDTCARVLDEPHSQSRRVIWVVSNNLNIDLDDVEQRVLSDSDEVAFRLAYRMAMEELHVIVDDYLKLNHDEQIKYLKRLHATVALHSHDDDSQHVAACGLLRGQMSDLLHKQLESSGL